MVFWYEFSRRALAPGSRKRINRGYRQARLGKSRYPPVSPLRKPTGAIVNPGWKTTTVPQDIKKYDLNDYPVNERDPHEIRALKKARDALANDPFFKDKKNKGLAEILHWLINNKRRCEQQAFYSVDPRDPQMAEKIILEKINKGHYV